MSVNISGLIRDEIITQNYDFKKVIEVVADGFKSGGFFDLPNWKNLLDQCFDRKRLGITNVEIEIYSSVLSDVSTIAREAADPLKTSYENAFLNGLETRSTPFPAGPSQNDGRMSRKRSSTTDAEKNVQALGKKFKKNLNSLDEPKLSNVLVDLKNTDWPKVCHLANEKQKSAKFVNIFERSKELTQPANENVSARAVNETGHNEHPSRVHKRFNTNRQPAQQPTKLIPAQGVQENVQMKTPRISKRRNAVCLPLSKSKRPTVSQSEQANVTEPTSINPKTAESVVEPKRSDDGQTAIQKSGVAITDRRTTRRQTQLLAAYSGTKRNNRSERRSSQMIQRTSVLFTMIDVKLYKDILQAFNIWLADGDKYDYVIAEQICRTPKFLSAVVSGKPIVSIEWLRALKNSGNWLDPLNFLLKDEDGEKTYDFSLSDTLTAATNKKLFTNYSIVVTPSCEIGPNSLKDVIFSGGGKYLRTRLKERKGDEVLCVSHEADKEMWPKLKNKYPTLQRIISVDGFSNMIFRYTYNVANSDVLQQY